MWDPELKFISNMETPTCVHDDLDGRINTLSWDSLSYSIAGYHISPNLALSPVLQSVTIQKTDYQSTMAKASMIRGIWNEKGVSSLQNTKGTPRRTESN